MKNLLTTLFIALFVLGSLPALPEEDTNSTAETANITGTASYAGDGYRISGSRAHEFRLFINRNRIDILIVGDGGSILICM